VIAVDQTTFGHGKGNCFAACVASILDLPIESVPNFCCDFTDDTWWAELKAWLRPRGCVPWFIDLNNDNREGALGLVREWAIVPYIGSGPNPDGVVHSTVWIGDAMAHDPNPSRRGITKLDDIILIVGSRPGVGS
jgi:hypothetical protein